MKIALIGYGKMGKAIEKKALSQGHSIVLKSNSMSPLESNINLLKKADVAIDFSTPSSAYDNIRLALQNQIPVVSGTTAWLNRYHEIVDLCKAQDGAFLYASNFSIGVNILFAINEKLAKLMKNKDYTPSIEEIHHTEKIDAPSGTAITLANQIVTSNDQLDHWKLVDNNDENVSKKLPITAKRIDKVPGTHSIKYTSSVDEIMLKHTAFSRDGFVSGALLAAKWIKDKKGVFTMQDVLSL